MFCHYDIGDKGHLTAADISSMISLEGKQYMPRVVAEIMELYGTDGVIKLDGFSRLNLALLEYKLDKVRQATKIAEGELERKLAEEQQRKVAEEQHTATATERELTLEHKSRVLERLQKLNQDAAEAAQAGAMVTLTGLLDAGADADGVHTTHPVHDGGSGVHIRARERYCRGFRGSLEPRGRLLRTSIQSIIMESVF
jgi:hypothetical protein